MRTWSRPAQQFHNWAQQAEGIYGGLDMLRTRPTPTPLSKVQHDARALNMEAGKLIAGKRDEAEG